MAKGKILATQLPSVMPKDAHHLYAFLIEIYVSDNVGLISVLITSANKNGSDKGASNG